MLAVLATLLLGPLPVEAQSTKADLRLYRLTEEIGDNQVSQKDPNSGALSHGFLGLFKDQPTGPFGLRLRISDAEFTATSSVVTVTNGTLEGWTKAPASQKFQGYSFTVVPDAEAASVTVAVAEGAITDQNSRLNNPISRTWTVKDSDAPIVMSMAFDPLSAGSSIPCELSSSNRPTNIDVVLIYSEQVHVTHGMDRPHVTFDVNGTEKDATYLDGSGSDALRFRYAMESGFTETGICALISSSVQMPSGSAIKETKAASPQDALSGLPPAPIYMESPRDLTSTDKDSPPQITAGRQYVYRIRFNQPVEVTGSPGVALEFSLAEPNEGGFSKTVCSSYVRHENPSELIFRYVVPRNHGFHPNEPPQVKTRMCASASSRITNLDGTQDATYYVYSHWDRVIRTEVGDSRRLWVSMGGIPAQDYVFSFRSDDTSLLELQNSMITFLGYIDPITGEEDVSRSNALTPQMIDFTVSDDEQNRGQSVEILYDVALTDNTVVATNRLLVTVILDTPLPPISLPPVNLGSGGSFKPHLRPPPPSTVDFEWTVEHDIGALHAGNTRPTDIWGDGKTVWVANGGGRASGTVYAYDLASGERVPEREFELDEGNRAPHGVWSDSKSFWVVASGRLAAYDLATGEHVPERDIELDSRNDDPRGIWGGGGVMWVLDGFRNALFAYDAESGALLGEFAFSTAHRIPLGIWSDGTTIWVTAHARSQIFAYRLPAIQAQKPGTESTSPRTLQRVREEEFTQLRRSGNTSPQGIWSDGSVMYVVDSGDDRVYTYNMPDAIDARLNSLALDGVDFGEFDPNRKLYVGAPATGVSEITVSFETTEPQATVVIAPPDADADSPGHQVTLEERGETVIVVVVYSADRSRTHVHVVQLSPPEPVPSAGQPAISDEQLGRLIGNTGGIGVAHRDQCADDARLPRFGWGDGLAVEVVAIGDGDCSGWLQVQEGGVTSWVREQYLLQA